MGVGKFRKRGKMLDLNNFLLNRRADRFSTQSRKSEPV